MQAPNKLLHQALVATAKSHGSKSAVIVDEKSYSFNELDSLSDGLSRFLNDSEVRRGDRVIVCQGNRVETIVAFWGILKSGGVICNIGVDTSSDNLNYIIADSQATALITTSEKLKEISPESLQILTKIVLLDGAGDYPYADTWERATSGKEQSTRMVNIIDVDLAAIVYTSGSTGKPKGVMLTHRNMCAALDSLNSYLDYKSSDTVLCSLPLSFDYGLYQMIMCVSRGATLILEKEFTWPIFLIKKIRCHQVTIIPFVPTMLMLLHEYAHRRGSVFPAVRMVTNTGAALKTQHIEQMKTLFPNAEIFSMYGLTECKRCTYLPPEQLGKRPESIGIAIPNTELWLIDDEGNRIAEPHRVGQLVIRGSTVMAGYWRNPKATSERLKPGPVPNELVLHTGDLCSLDEDGYLYFKGRMDHVIKSRGIKVSPVQIESYLYGLPGVEAASVVGIEHQTAGGLLWAFVKPAEGVLLNTSDLLAQCRSDLEPYQVPHEIRVITSFPRTPNGKFDVLYLKRLAEQELQSIPIAA